VRDYDFLIPVVAILAWAAIMISRVHTRSRQREFAHRERMAMIERGLVPPPDKDPEAFERLMRWQNDPERRGRHRRAELRFAGVLMLCIGTGLGLLISLASDDGDTNRVAIGVGGLVGMIGIAFLINSVLEPSGPPESTLPPSSRPTDPR
jgi:hypothetical protein